MYKMQPAGNDNTPIFKALLVSPPVTESTLLLVPVVPVVPVVALLCRCKNPSMEVRMLVARVAAPVAGRLPRDRYVEWK